MNANENALLTVREVAQILRVPASWVYDHTRPKCRNPLPCVKIGKYLRFFDHDIRVIWKQCARGTCTVSRLPIKEVERASPIDVMLLAPLKEDRQRARV